MTIPDSEVKPKKPRRRLTVKYKLGILKQAKACKKKGELGALLRREGLYSSALTRWLKQYQEGAFKDHQEKKRGKKAKAVNPLEKKVKQLEKEKKQLEKKLHQAEKIIEFQKKIAELLDQGTSVMSR